MLLYYGGTNTHRDTQEGDAGMCDQAEAIQTWLTTHLAEQLGVAPHDIDVRAPFTEYGLDSLVGVSITGDLEDWLGLQLSPTLLWDYCTIETLARYLAEEIKGNQDTGQSAAWYSQANGMETRGDQDGAARLLATLDELSDTTMDGLFTDLLATEETYDAREAALPATALCL
jgi:acyl carrier protein